MVLNVYTYETTKAGRWLQVFEKNENFFLVKDMDIACIGLSQGKSRITGPESSGRVNAERDMPALILFHAVSVAQVDHQGLMAGVIILFAAPAAGPYAQGLGRIQHDYGIGYGLVPGMRIPAVWVRLPLQCDDPVIIVYADSAGEDDAVPIHRKRITVSLPRRRCPARPGGSKALQQGQIPDLVPLDLDRKSVV